MIPLLSTLILIVLALRVGSENDLAARIKKGDKAAFKAFFDQHYAGLLSFLYRRGLDKGAAEDLVQNAFIAIWEHRDKIDPEKSLKSYLFRIGYTRALNYFRDRSKYDFNTDPSSTQQTVPQSDPVEYQQLMNNLDHAIGQLPERRRLVFELCFMQGLSYREAAESLSISVKTVENQMGHALKAIRIALNAYKPTPK